jgi:hypothetical protein
MTRSLQASKIFCLRYRGYIPMRQGKWSPAYRKTNTYQLEHYLIAKFGELPLRKFDSI